MELGWLYYLSMFLIGGLSLALLTDRSDDGKLTIGDVVIAVCLTFIPIVNSIVLCILGIILVLGIFMEIMTTNISRRKK